MATPTVTQESSFTDGWRATHGQSMLPSTAYRITGGTADDRLTMDEIVADSTMAGLITFDPDTGVVKRVGASPTPYTFLFGSGAPQTTITSGSTTTVINVSDATGFTTTGKVRVNNDRNREREISSISGNQITLATALPSSPNNGQRVKFLEDPDSITPDCYVELVGVTFDLHSNAGTDTSAQDLGDETDKIIFSDYCDVVIGSDVGDPSAPDAGNCAIIAENFSWGFYRYTEVFQEGTKVTCNGYLTLVMKENSRPALANRNTNSIIRVILAGHSISPFANNFRCNIDLSVASQEILMYGGQINFRPTLVPGGIQSDEFVLPAATAANGGTVYLYWQNSPFATTGYTVRGLQTIREVGETEQPQIDIQSADGSDMLVKLTEFGGKQADEFFRFSADDGHLTTEISQKVNFKIRDAANSAVSASHLEVDSGSYSITYAPNDLGTPTISTTDYDTVQDFQDVSDQDVEIMSKVFACNEGNNQDFREVSASSITSADLSPLRYSIWAWGYNIIYRTAFTLEDEVGEADLVVVLPEDNLVTASTKDDVVSAATTFDDIYDQLAEYAFDNNQDIACTVENGVLTFSDSDVTFADGGSMSRASDAITVPCSSIVAAGTKISQLNIDGTATLESGVVITGTYQDTNGIRVIVAGYPAGTRGSVAFWLASQGEKNRNNAVTAATFEVRTDVRVDATNNRFITTGGDFRSYGVGSTLITSLFTEEDNNGEFTIDSISADGRSCDVTVPAGRNALVDEAAGGTVELENGSATTLNVILEPDTEYFMVADAVSYLRSSTLQLNTGQTTAVRGSLRRITDAAGNDLIPAASDLTDEEIEALKLIKYEVGNDVIRFGATNEINEFTFREIARAIEVGQSRPNALLNEYICLIAEGSFSFEADSGRMITRDSGVADDLVPDLSGFQFTKIGTTDTKDFVDYSNGAIIVNAGIPAVITVSLDVDDVNVTQDTWDARMLAVPNSTKNEYKGTGGGSGGTDPVDVVGASIFGNSFKGEWAVGDYAVDDVVWHVDSELFYKCTVARDSTHTDDPSVDTSSWEVAKVEAGGGSGSLDQATFNTRMENVPDATKDTYKGSGGGGSEDTIIEAIGASIFGDDFKGEWAAGVYSEEDVVWFTDRFYTCTDDRVATDTDDPATDTASWRTASGMVYSQVLNAYYDPVQLRRNIET